jgi:hypothetical protein
MNMYRFTSVTGKQVSVFPPDVFLEVPTKEDRVTHDIPEDAQCTLWYKEHGWGLNKSIDEITRELEDCMFPFRATSKVSCE